MPLILPGNVGSATAATGFDVANSVRFNSGDSAYMHKTPNSAGSLTAWTLSMWVKRSKLGAVQFLASAIEDGDNYTAIKFEGDDILSWQEYVGGSRVVAKRTNAFFRDVSAWMHIVIYQKPSAQTIYVNGVEITSWRTDTSGNASSTWNDAIAHNIGRSADGSYFGGYMAEVCFVNNASLAPTSFGEFDEDSGIWKPIDVSGLTFGTNGFYLDFEDSGNLGNDANGGTDFTEVNLAATDQATDTCTNNFATANPLANLVGAPTYSEGNLEITGDNSANHNWQSTIGVSSGKWYWEMKSTASSPDTGLMFYDQSITSQNHAGEGFATSGRLKIINNSTTGSAIGSTAQNDIHGMALDLDNGKMFIHRNGTYIESGDPANGTNPFIETSDGLETEGVIGGFVYDGTVQINFGGCPAFAISSGNADGNGFGNFEYAPPSGFFALCTKNLAENG